MSMSAAFLCLFDRAEFVLLHASSLSRTKLKFSQFPLCHRGKRVDELLSNQAVPRGSPFRRAAFLPSWRKIASLVAMSDLHEVILHI